MMRTWNALSLSSLLGSTASALQAPTADLGYVKYMGVSDAALG